MVHPVLLKAAGMPCKMKELHKKTLELFNMENIRYIFVIMSSTLHRETNFVRQV